MKCISLTTLILVTPPFSILLLEPAVLLAQCASDGFPTRFDRGVLRGSQLRADVRT